VTSAVLAALAVWLALPRSAAGRVRAVFGPVRSSRHLDLSIVAALVVPFALLMLLGWPTGALVGAIAAPVAHRAIGQLESAAGRQRAARIAAQLPSALDLMVATLDVGRPPVTAFALAAEATSSPLGSELAGVAHRLAVSGDSMAVWRSVEHDPALAPVGRAFRRAESSGMPVARVVAGVADDLRRERRARRRDDSRKVAVRTAAPLGVCFLPAFFLIGIVPTIISTFRAFSF
jgi:Flp pilus assembly protein TadB